MKKEIDYIAADFETTTLDQSKSSHVYLANWMYIFDESEQDHYSYSVEEFLDSLKKCPNDFIICFFHNGGKFDTQFILWFLFKNGYSQVPKVSHVKNNKTIYIMEDVDKRYRVVFYYGNKRIDLRDSFLLTLAPAKELGEVYSKEKLKYDYNIKLKKDPKTKTDIENNKLAHAYIHNDVAIIRRALYHHKIFWGSLNYITIATQTYAPLIKIINKYKLKLTLDEYNKFRMWYRGSYCSHKIGITNKWHYGNFYNYDINSSFPYAQTFPMPIGQPLKTPPKDKPYYRFMKIYIKHAKIKNKKWIPILPKMVGLKSDNETEYVFETTNQIVYFISFEWDWILKWYDVEYEVLENWYFEAKIIFKRFIENLFLKKHRAKLQNDKIQYRLAKTGINAPYGKFCQKPIFENVYYLTPDELDKYQKKNYELIRARTNSNDIGNKKAYILITPPDELKKELDIKYVPVGAVITAISRVNLFKGIWENMDHTLYADCDSIITNKPAVGLKIDKYKLGWWKLEYVGNQLNVLKTKFYRICDKDGNIIKSASAGIDREIIKKVPNKKYKIGMKIKLGKKRVLKVTGGVVIFSQDTIIGKVNNMPDYGGISDGVMNEEFL